MPMNFLVRIDTTNLYLRHFPTKIEKSNNIPILIQLEEDIITAVLTWWMLVPCFNKSGPASEYLLIANLQWHCTVFSNVIRIGSFGPRYFHHFVLGIV